MFEPPPVADQTDSKRIRWYRSPVEKSELRSLYRRTDWQGFVQTLGYLAVLVSTASLVLYSTFHWPWYATVALLFLHGTVFAFQINAVHELGHLTVFKTRRLNIFFEHIFAFLGWINHRMFFASHSRHHHSTLHPPDDLEVVVPIKITVKDFLLNGIVNPRAILGGLRYQWRIAKGKFVGDWELTLYPDDQPELRKPPVAWARTLLIGHGAIVVGSAVMGWWMLPVVTTFAPFYGGMLFLLCNNTQHVGMKDFSTDFRECCRTFEVNPIVRFLYWHMNYHIEHHMYVGVPCYNLGKLHRLIRDDIPPSPRGLIATWREIGSILEKQKKDPSYVFTWRPHTSGQPGS